MTSEQQFRGRLNSLLEGIQIIDYDWRYVYLNDVMTLQSKTDKEELLGYTMMEKFPGIEDTPLFGLLRQTMNDRQAHRTENQFVYPDKTVKWFDLCIQPAEEGICILSLDITQHKEAEEKIRRSKSLYSFLSHINQSIVHLTNEKDLYFSACRAAIGFGSFKIAWIGIFDDNYETINLVEQCGLDDDILPQFDHLKLTSNGPQRKVIDGSKYFLCNDIESNFDHPEIKKLGDELGVSSFVVLPLCKGNKIIGTFNLYSEKQNFIGVDEILLLEEVTSDISFALFNFEKDRIHRETEQVIVKNEKRFRALIEKSADMKVMATADGKLFYGSPSITKVLGYDIEKMMHSSLFNIIHPDDVGEFSEKRTNLIKHPGESIFFEARLRHAHGHWVWCEGTATNLLQESGVHAVVSNFRDVSEKKKAEQQVEFDRNNTNALINNTDDLMWSINDQMKLITGNRAFHDLSTKVYGSSLSKGEYIFRPGLSTANRKMYEKMYQKALGGKSFRQTVRLTIPDGNWSEISLSPIWEKEKVIGVACHSRDITARMNTEKELANQNKELIKTNFELDRFVYSVSHDLRSPLTSILGLVSIIEAESNETETQKHVGMIKSGIHRLDGFIKNILNYSRNNRLQNEIVAVNLSDTVTEIVETLRHSKEANEIDFAVEFEETSPFYSDKQSIHTMFENIISNAIKFRKRDTDNSFIKIKGQTSEDFLEVSIQDNGIGINAEHLNRIFEMFFRSSASIEGSGIGLYIVREIITKLHGNIHAESEAGKGTTFHIRLKNMKP